MYQQGTGKDVFRRIRWIWNPWALLLTCCFAIYMFSNFTKFYDTLLFLVVPIFFACLGAIRCICQKHYITGGAILFLLILMVYRLFHGPFDLFEEYHDTVLGNELTAVVLTVEGSERANTTIDWVSKLNLNVVISKDKPISTVFNLNEVFEKFGWHESCKYFANDTRTLFYALRWYKFLESVGSYVDTPWIMVLEDDAIPIAHPIGTKLGRSVAFDQDYDLIWLDNRNFWSDFLPIPTVYIGTAGNLIRKDSISEILKCFRYNEKYCWSGIALGGCDTLLSVCCKTGRIKCRARPYIRESGATSTLRGNLPA